MARRTVATGVLRRLRRRRVAADDGFTLIELMAAMVVLMLVMSAMLSVFIGSIQTIARAKQRQQATALATQTMEQLRALPYDVIVSGVNRANAAFTADPLIVDKVGTPRFVPGIGSIDEVLVTNTTSTTAPLTPHVTKPPKEEFEDVEYTIGTYVTRATTAQPAYNLTVLVSYQTPLSGGPMTVIERSTAFSPAGCLSTASHPFSGPCQPSFTAQADVTPGSVQLTSTSGDATGLAAAFGVSSVELGLTSMGNSIQVEQTANVTTTGQTTSVSTGGAPVSGGVSKAAAADTDPSSESATTGSFSLMPSGAVEIESSGTAGSVTSRPNTSDGGAGTAQTAATSNCTSPSGLQIGTGQPCASSLGTAAGDTAYLRAHLDHVGDQFDLVDVAPPGSATVGVATRMTGSVGGYCAGSGTAAADCAVADVSRAVGTLSAGRLPGGFSSTDAPGFTGPALTLTGFSESARAESGTRPGAPVYTRAGTLTVWTDTGYVAYPLAGAAPRSLTVPEVTRAYGDHVAMSVSGTVTVNAPTTTRVTTPCTASTPCTAQLTSGSAMRADLQYRVTYTHEDHTVEVFSFAVLVDLGGLVADTSYRAASSD